MTYREGTLREGTLTDAHDLSLSGLVTGEDGKPVAGAIVHADERKRDGRRASEMTGADGRYRFGELAAGGWSVWVEKEGLTKTRNYEHFVRLPSVAPAQVDMVLFNARSLAVRIRNEKGDPVEGAKVIVDREYLSDGTSLTPNSASDLATAVTGADGNAVLSGLRPYGAGLLVFHPNYAPWTGGPFAVGGDPVTIMINKGGMIFGRVEFEGRPLAGVPVQIVGALMSHRNLGDMQVATTDAEGRYRAERLFVGNDQISHWDRSISVLTDEYISDTYRCDLNPTHPEHEVNVVVRRKTEGAVPSVTMVYKAPDLSSSKSRVQGTGEIQGIACDFEGRPLAGRRVRLCRIDQTWAAISEQVWRDAVTDAQGRFVMSALPSGEYLLFDDRIGNPGPWLTPVFASLSDGQKHAVKLFEGGSVISGNLHAPSEELKSASAGIRGRDPDNAWTYAANIIASVRVDPETGRFEFPPLAAGTYEVSAHGSSGTLHDAYGSQTKQVTIDGEHPAAIEISAPRGRIEGVIDAPAPEWAVVRLTGPINALARLRDVAEFSFSWLPEGKYFVAVTGHPRIVPTPQAVEVRAGAPTRVEFKPTANSGSLLMEYSLVKLAKDEAEAPSVGCYALVTGDEGSGSPHVHVSSDYSVQDKSCGISSLSPGAVMLVATAHYWNRSASEKEIVIVPRVEIAAGQTSVVHVEFVPQPAVRITCVTERGRAAMFEMIPGLHIRLKRSGQYALDWTEGDSLLDGAGILHLAPGHYRLEGNAPGYEAVGMDFALESGAAPQDVTLVLKEKPE